MFDKVHVCTSISERNVNHYIDINLGHKIVKGWQYLTQIYKYLFPTFDLLFLLQFLICTDSMFS